MNINRICVVGLGYIGLPTAALLANRGYMVYGVDVVQRVVDTINRGEIHIVEPELDTFVRSAVNGGKLIAGTQPQEADVFIIAVPTPFHDNYVPNIDYVISATKSISPYLKDGNIIILESTSPVGTTDKIVETLESMNINTDKLHIAHCPERVLPGKVMKELIENDRIVGGTKEESTKLVKAFYESFVSGAVLITDAKTAEMCKLVENSYRDTNIAFANELSMICDKANINVWELIKLANKHPRVNILQPGAGVGGHCIAVDPWFIVSAYPEEAKVIKQARLSNDYKSEWVSEKIKNAALQFELKHQRKARVAYFGLAFKPDIDDLRESPAVHIVKRALETEGEKENTLVVEPNISEHPIFDLVNYKNAYENADIIAFLVAHKEFKQLENNSEKIILDFCGVTAKN
ncbi:UDP-N-acetyl-D-mannosamine dehydrogenase [Pedobacter nyackensis]|uniref:UDP-N-acetyl-D-mannosamine dehydrogenase n=1 Tax=Pedobacter nyackensis TaxID=475255 RepID=UPI00292D9426|nr:UDP-N-acetyl-D-mannosamine dehydrogenase [Pedobacter nyackensis]